MAVNAFYDGRIRKESENRETLQFLASQMPCEMDLGKDLDKAA